MKPSPEGRSKRDGANKTLRVGIRKKIVIILVPGLGEDSVIANSLVGYYPFQDLNLCGFRVQDYYFQRGIDMKAGQMFIKRMQPNLHTTQSHV